MAALRSGRCSLAAQSVRAVRSLLTQSVAHSHSAVLPTPAYATSRRLHVSVGGPGDVVRTCAEALGISSRRLRRWSLRHTCNAFAAAPSTARQARARATLRSGHVHWRGHSRSHHSRAFSTAGGAAVAGDDDDYVGDAEHHRHALDLPAGVAKFAYTFDKQFVLIVPEAADGSGRIEFRFTIGDSVGKVARQLTNELGRRFRITDAEGGKLSNGTLLADVAASGFIVDDAGTPLAVAPIEFEGNLPKFNDGRVHLLSLMQKSAYMRVRKILEADPRRHMSRQDATKVCTSCGMSVEEADKLLGKLHDVGAILYFKNATNPTIRNIVFLKPEEVADEVFSEFGLQSPTQLFVAEQAKIKERQLTALRDRHAEMKMLQDVLAGRANSAARVASWTGFGALASGVGFYWWLVYDYLSWDIMEPVTYFTNSFFVIVGFVWWFFSSSDFEYGNLRGAMYQRRLRKLHDKHGFDPERFEQLSKLLASVEAEVAHLDLTGYNPALIASYLARNTSLSDAMTNTPGAGSDTNSNADLKLQYDILLEREQRKK